MADDSRLLQSRPFTKPRVHRHCPKCQRVATERWLTDRRRELLPIPYFHVVFTLPHELNPLAQSRIGLPEARQDPDERNLICLAHDAIEEEPQHVGAPLRSAGSAAPRPPHTRHGVPAPGPGSRFRLRTGLCAP